MVDNPPADRGAAAALPLSPEAVVEPDVGETNADAAEAVFAADVEMGYGGAGPVVVPGPLLECDCCCCCPDELFPPRSAAPAPAPAPPGAAPPAPPDSLDDAVVADCVRFKAAEAERLDERAVEDED